MKRYVLVLIVFALALSACGSNQAEASASLVGTWMLSSYGAANDPAPVVPDSGAEIVFNEDGTVGGNSGCNGFGGTYTVEGDQVTFSEIVSTLMACDDPRMTQEEAVLQVLGGTATFQIDGNTLTLTNNDRILVFTK